MKKLLPRAALSLLALSSLMTAPLQAATVGSGFNVQVNLTSTCVIEAPATPLDFGAYTAFGTTAPAPTATVKFKCTQGFSPTAVQFDTGPAPLATASAAGTTATGGGVIAGLLYGLSVAAPVNTAGAAATSTAGAGADIKTYTVTGSMAAGQAGSGAGGAATQVRTLTITY